MIFNGIDFPDEIISAVREDKLVIFAGAGVSVNKPTSLPNFENLTKEIAEDTGETIKKGIAFEEFLGNLKASKIDVNTAAAKILNRTCLMHNKLHETIVDFFPMIEKTRIVTTNYDKMFEKAIRAKGGDVDVYSAPALPLGDDFYGIIHIHGIVDSPEYMVLTDEDFGKAYLTEGYASRFLIKLFQSYTVLFIGYSYNDTILRYLTRAMLREDNKKKYILTDNSKKDWDVLGINPITYPSRQHAKMRDALAKLGNESKKELSDWKGFFESIKKNPPRDLTEKTIISYCLKDEHICQVMASCIQGNNWLDYLDERNVFDGLFSNKTEILGKDSIWLNWIVNSFVGKDDETLKNFIYKHKEKISLHFANAIIWKILSMRETIKDSLFAEYYALAGDRVNDPYVILRLVENAYNNNQLYICLELIKKMFGVKILTEKEYWLTADSYTYNHSFLGDYYVTNRAWEIVKERALNQFPYEIMFFVREKIEEIHSKYEMLSRASDDFEPWEIVNVDLEGQREYTEDEPILVLNRMFLSCAKNLEIKDRDFLKAFLKMCMYSHSILMKNICLLTIRETTVFSEKEKVSLIVKEKLLNETWCKEQVFKLAASIFARLNCKNQNEFLDSIDNEYKNSEQELDKYGLYNWYVWLKRVDINNNRIDDLINQYHIKYGFEPREYPEKNTYSFSGRWSGGISPYTEEALMNMPIEKAVNEINTYKGNVFDGPSRLGLLGVFSKCCKKDNKWAYLALSKLIEKGIKTEDVWQYYFYGVNDANCDIDKRISIINIVADSFEIVPCIKEFSEYVLKTIRQKDFYQDYKKYEKQIFIALDKIWERRGIDSFDFPRLIDATLNTITGIVTMTWVYMFSYADENAMSQEYKKFFENALNLPIKEKKITTCILAGYFNLFCVKDREWCLERLVPLLTDRNKNIFNAAWEGVVNFSYWISSETSDVWIPIYLKAIKQIKFLSDNSKKGFMKLLVLLMMQYIDKPTVEFIPELYKNISIIDRKIFIRKIRYQLSDMDGKGKKDWWDKWLKKFIENRKKNKPCLLESAENEEIFMLLPELGEFFDEALDVICIGTIPNEIDDLFWLNLSKTQIASKYPDSMYKLITTLLKAVSNLGIGEESIKKIIKEIGPLDAKKQKKLEDVMLKHNIDMV